MKIKPGKYSGLNGIRTHDPCDTGAAVNQRRYQAQLKAGNFSFISARISEIPILSDKVDINLVYQTNYPMQQ